MKGQVVQERRISIEMSEGEARILRGICGSIAGNHEGPRGATEALQEAIEEALGIGDEEGYPPIMFRIGLEIARVVRII